MEVDWTQAAIIIARESSGNILVSPLRLLNIIKENDTGYFIKLRDTYGARLLPRIAELKSMFHNCIKEYTGGHIISHLTIDQELAVTVTFLKYF